MQGGHGAANGRELDFRDQIRRLSRRGSEVTLFSRNQKLINKRFPKIVQALASLENEFVFDGELVAFDPQGRPSFQLLQNNRSRTFPVYFYAFDLLNRAGGLLLSLPIEPRRELLGRMRFIAKTVPVSLMKPATMETGAADLWAREARNARC